MSSPQLGTVNVALTISQVQFPAGTSQGGGVVTLTGSAAGNTTPQTQAWAAGAASVSFSALPPDTYAISVQNQDGNGNNLGAALTGQIVVIEPTTVTLSVATAFQASQAS